MRGCSFKSKRGVERALERKSPREQRFTIALNQLSGKRCCMRLEALRPDGTCTINGKRECGPERVARLYAEGKALKGVNPKGATGMK
jgi:hypothetical protein